MYGETLLRDKVVVAPFMLFCMVTVTASVTNTQQKNEYSSMLATTRITNAHNDTKKSLNFNCNGNVFGQQLCTQHIFLQKWIQHIRLANIK